MPNKKRTPRTLLCLCLATTALVPLTAQAEEVTELDPILLQTFEGPEVDGYVATTSSAATKTSTPLVKTPVTVNVVTADQIAEQGWESVAEALSYTPNVLTNYRGESTIYDETFIRGFEYAPKFLNGSQFGTYGFGQLDPFLLGRVEVVKGPNSVIFGQAMPGGVVNMATKTPSYDNQSNQVVLSFGSDKFRQVSADLQGKLNEEGTAVWRLVALGSDRNLEGDDFGQSRLVFAPSVKWEITPDSELELDFIYQDDPEAGQRQFLTREGTLDPTPGGFYYRSDLMSLAPEYDNLERETYSGGMRFRHSFDNGLIYRSSFRYTEIDQLHNGVYVDQINKFDSDDLADLGVVWIHDAYEQLTFDNSLQANFELGQSQHEVLFGVDYQSYTQTDNNRTNWSTPLQYDLSTQAPITLADDPDQYLYGDWLTETKVKQAGVYFQDTITMGALNVLLGARYDWADTVVTGISAGYVDTYEDQAFTGRIGFSYELANGLVPYASYSTSFEPVNEYGGPTGDQLKPSMGRQFEVGAKWESADGRMMITGAYFDIEQTNLTEYDYSLGYYQNIGTKRSKGIEIEAKAEVTDRLSVIASYGKVDAKMTSGANAGSTARRIPESTAALWLNYELLKGLRGAVGVRYTGQSYGDYYEGLVVPSSTIYDLGLSADLGEFNDALRGAKLNLSVTNVTDEVYVSSCIASWDDYCWYGEGREIRASLSYEW